MRAAEQKAGGDKRTAIFESALALLREQGFHGTPMSQVAKNAGVAAGTLYLYFDSKDELIRELYLHVRDRMMEAVLQGDNPALAFKNRLFNFWENHFRFYVNNPDCLFFMEQFYSSPYGCGVSLHDHEGFKQTILRLFTCGVESGKLKKMEIGMFSVIIHGSIIAAAKSHLSGRVHFGKKELRQMLNIVWDGIRKKDATER